MFHKDLQPGERLKIDTGCLVGFTQSIRYDIEMIRGVRNKLFGVKASFMQRSQGPVAYGYKLYR
ncbi:AIM24 family protein [Niabella sp. W65]|nr:AIM24 family protein [Niabella sp. W65]MCH7362169.1 AIM24 family protein [Niabella sp. W65]ULT45911.1 AIM24 family protein [Niabella sp. I65]